MANLTYASLVGSSHKWTWALTTADPTGDVVEQPGASDRSVQVVATAAGGAVLVLEGSNDGVNYQTLHDEIGVALSFSASGMHAIVENVQYIRPRLSTVGSGAVWSVYMVARFTR